jgi:TPR repeat protein
MQSIQNSGRLAFISATLMALFFHSGIFAQSYDLTEMYPDKRAMTAANKSVKKGKMDVAFNRYLEAAAYGNKQAQKMVGLSYLDGSGTKQDSAKACAWLRLASTTGNRRLVTAYDDLAAKLGEDDVKSADKEFGKLQKKYSDESALKKRKKWVRRELKDSAGSGASRPSSNTQVSISLIPGRMTKITYGELSDTLDNYVEDFEKKLEPADS